MNAPHTNPVAQPWGDRWSRFSAAALRAFHAYAGWLVSITWKRFAALALLLIVMMAILHDLPPLTWTITERIEPDAQEPKAAKAVNPPVLKPAPTVRTGEGTVRVETPPSTSGRPGLEIQIDKNGVRIGPKAATTPPADAPAGNRRAPDDFSAVTADEVRRALEQAKKEIEASAKEAREDLEEAQRDAEQARAEAQAAIDELANGSGKAKRSTRVTRVGIGDLLMQLTLFWVVGSIAIKATYKGRLQAEVKAQAASQTAEAESLKRQVVEARMAVMQAQVEPHFLFNTLASIDHLITADPVRASQMQKNLIALLRASMPTLRDTHDGTPRDLGRELALIKPYLEILKVRMEERLEVHIQVSDGLLSAEFPSMMVQTLVENAIKHGLEPKAAGGQLHVAAEIVHGKLQVTVADTGLGFGQAATAGTGVGLANIRERLQLLYGGKATLTVTENQPCGTRVTVTVPYKTLFDTAAASATTPAQSV